MTVDDLITGMLREDGGFQMEFRRILDEELGISLNEFCQFAGISQSTLYKVLEGEREPNLRTVRQVVKALRMLDKSQSTLFIAIIAASTALQDVPKEIEVRGRKVSIREYTVSTVEDAIVAAVRAERDGALGVVCAPIVAPTVEKILSIPVSLVVPTKSIPVAIENLMDSL